MYLSALNTSRFFSFYSCRTCPTKFKELWANVDRIISKMQRSPIPVPGDGFCFLSSIIQALDKDQNIHITIVQARQLILDFLLHNYNNYVDFYSCQMNACQPLVSMSDALLSEMVQFFDDG